MPLAVLDLDVGQSLGAVNLDEFRQVVDLLAGELRASLGIDTL